MLQIHKKGSSTAYLSMNFFKIPLSWITDFNMRDASCDFVVSVKNRPLFTLKI